MSEQRYYVRLKIDGQLLSSSGFYDEELGCDEYNEFTKSELAKIMDGAFYSVSEEKCNYCRYSGDTCGDEHCEEWINPLIELVPVEDDE